MDLKEEFVLEVKELQRTSSDFNENQPKHQNRNFLQTFCKPL